MKKTIILCNESYVCSEPIKDRIEYSNLPVNVQYAHTHTEAVSLVPENESCLIITNSVIPGEGIKNPTDGAIALLKNSKAKNPKCDVILYAPPFLKIDKSGFDASINLLEHNSFDMLFAEIERFCKN